MKNKFRKRNLATVTALALILGVGATSVSAAPPVDQTKNVEIIVEGGELSFTAPDIVNFNNVTLKDVSQTVSTGFSGPVSVSDARGTGEGWKLNVSATVFKTQIGGSDYTLPSGKLSLKTATSITPKIGADTTGLNNLIVNSVNIDGLGAIPVASSSANYGKGITDITFPTSDALNLIIDPSDIKVDAVNKTSKYTAVLTWSLTDAP